MLPEVVCHAFGGAFAWFNPFNDPVWSYMPGTWGYLAGAFYSQFYVAIGGGGGGGGGPGRQDHLSDCVPTAMEIYLENTHPGKSYDKNTIMQYLRIERGRKINWDTDGVDFTTMIRVFKEYYEIDAYIPDKELHSDPYDLNLLDTLTKNGSSIFLTTNAPGSRLHTILLRGVRGIGEEKGVLGRRSFKK